MLIVYVNQSRGLELKHCVSKACSLNHYQTLVNSFPFSFGKRWMGLVYVVVDINRYHYLFYFSSSCLHLHSVLSIHTVLTPPSPVWFCPLDLSASCFHLFSSDFCICLRGTWGFWWILLVPSPFFCLFLEDCFCHRLQLPHLWLPFSVD